jgi:hypothetical protein
VVVGTEHRHIMEFLPQQHIQIAVVVVVVDLQTTLTEIV